MKVYYTCLRENHGNTKEEWHHPSCNYYFASLTYCARVLRPHWMNYSVISETKTKFSLIWQCPTISAIISKIIVMASVSWIHANEIKIIRILRYLNFWLITEIVGWPTQTISNANNDNELATPHIKVDCE